ncbi:arsenite methyltransferase [bacterium]|nr:arsenite methyltransferase [bacterium]
MSGCCGSNREQNVRTQVREHYGQIAEAGAGQRGGCCGTEERDNDSIARAIGYSDTELSNLPEGANLGLSCGNPTAIASLRPGEVVLDLGSGGGFDVFIAASRVGAAGRAIGVDMTAAMLERARGNSAAFHAQSGLDNVEFRLGEIEHLPVADSSVDVVISNCVINLSPDKPQVWREIARVLRPGGRVAVSDLALLKPLPEAVLSSVRALTGCIAGAVTVDETRRMAQAAGLTDILLTPKTKYVDQTPWDDPFYADIIRKLPSGAKLSDYVTSLDVSAVKLS